MVSFRWALFIPALTLLEAPTPFQPAALAEQPSAGTIVFVHAPDGGPPWPVEDLYSMDADGANVKPLTHDGHSHDPAWSPDGRHILFVGESTLQAKPAYKEEKQYESHHSVELCVMDRDGKSRRVLRRMEPGIFGAAWSPDGKTIAVSALPGVSAKGARPGSAPAREGLFLLAADGRGEPQLLVRDALTPAWSPDGKRLAFSVERPRGQWAVHVANSDGSHDTQLTEPSLLGGSPEWSPDGRLIAFDQFAGRNGQIFVMDAGGAHQRQITEDSNWSCVHPSWSADGKRLAFSCRSAGTPCGGVSSVGTILPACTRRLFVVSAFDVNARPIQLGDLDAAMPVFAPGRPSLGLPAERPQFGR